MKHVNVYIIIIQYEIMQFIRQYELCFDLIYFVVFQNKFLENMLKTSRDTPKLKFCPIPTSR